jgi:phage shock protein A
MASPPVTRKVLARAIVVDAAKRPLNVGVGVAVLAAAIVLDAVWLLPLALLVYAGMVVATALDGDRAERVGTETYDRRKKQLPPAGDELRPYLSPRVTAAVAVAADAERRIRKAIDSTDFPLADVEAEVDRLMAGVRQLARNADRLAEFLAEEDAPAVRSRLEQARAATSDDPALARMNADAVAALEEQLAAHEQIERQLARFEAQLQHIGASLGTIHAQIVRMSVEEEAGAQRRVADEVRALRREVGSTADALAEAFSDVRE